jgi:hypothetical protein
MTKQVPVYNGSGKLIGMRDARPKPNPIPQYGQTRLDAFAAAIRQECERQECIPRRRLLDLLEMYV